MSEEIDPQLILAIKIAQTQIVNEWLDRKFATVGKWSLMGIMALLFSLFVHYLLSSYGNQTINQVIQDAVAHHG